MARRTLTLCHRPVGPWALPAQGLPPAGCRQPASFVPKSGMVGRGTAAKGRASSSEARCCHMARGQVDCIGLVGVELVVQRLTIGCLLELEVSGMEGPRRGGCHWVSEAEQAAMQGSEIRLSTTPTDQAVVLKQGWRLREDGASQERRAGGGGGGGEDHRGSGRQQCVGPARLWPRERALCWRLGARGASGN